MVHCRFWRVYILVFCIFFLGVVSCAAQENQTNVSEFTFYAVYDRLVDTDTDNVRIGPMVMSGDGTRLLFSAADAETGDPLLLTMNVTDENFTAISLPDLKGMGITGLGITDNGSPAFFTNGAALYRVNGDSASLILATAGTDLTSIRDIRCTADGSSVYFRDVAAYSSDIWRVGGDGSGLEKIIEDSEVLRDDSGGGQGYLVDEFAISADGMPLAFIMAGYLDPENIHIINTKPELFVYDGTETRQITNDDEIVGKLRLAMSGDGSVIVYDRSGEEDQYYAIQSDAGNQTPLEYALFNFGGMDLTYNGSQLYYADALADGGRMVYTNGSGRLDLFPRFNVATIALSATGSMTTSNTGERIAFVHQYSSWPFKEALYVGYLNESDAVEDAPVIQSVDFDPSSLPVGDPNARINVTAMINDPEGLSTILRTSTDGLVDGYLGSWQGLPVYFNFAVHDDGLIPDEAEGDGIYSTSGQPGETIGEENEMTVRIGVQDANFTVTIADSTLSIGE
jgi:hypothetical protein